MNKICTLVGGGGFIGSVLCEVLIKKGRIVRVLDRLDKSEVNLPKSVEYQQGDFNDNRILENNIYDTDEIINLAYATYPKTSFENPVFDILQNLPPSVNLLEKASQLPIKKMIFVSSGGTIYGQPNYLPIDELHPLNPISPYGITKLAIEKYCRMFYELKGLPVLCVRPSNPYGVGQKAFRGQGFISTAISSILQNKTIQIYGENGTIRDYIHIQDLVEGIYAALELGKEGEIYNIGTGIGTDNLKIISILKTLAEVTDFSVKYEILPNRAYDVSVNILNIEKLSIDTGWNPKITLNDGIKELWVQSIKEFNKSR